MLIHIKDENNDVIEIFVNPMELAMLTKEDLEKVYNEMKDRVAIDDVADEVLMNGQMLGCIEVKGLKIRFRGLTRRRCYRLKINQSEPILVWAYNIDDALRRANDAMKDGSLYFVSPKTNVTCCDSRFDEHGTYINPREETSIRWLGEPGEHSEFSELQESMPEKFNGHPEYMTIFEWVEFLKPVLDQHLQVRFVFNGPDGKHVEIKDEGIYNPYIECDGIAGQLRDIYGDGMIFKEIFSQKAWTLDVQASKESLQYVRQKFDNIRKAYELSLSLFGGAEDG